MRRYMHVLMATLFCSLYVTSSFAWNALGHMVIADIAYQKLTPEVRKKVDVFVKRFRTDYPDITSFTQIAPWPDSLRSQKIESFTRWHYINLAFTEDNSPLKNLVDTDNAVWAIKNLKNPIANEHAKTFERARLLAFFTHIVGDLHQPLHAVARISRDFPDGDEGGNKFYVVYKNKRTKLHKIWDEGLGAFEGNANDENANSTATRLMALYPETFFAGKAKDFSAENWASEGLENSKKYVYSTPEERSVSQAYIQNGRAFAQQQAVLAGYRLAGILNQILR